MKRALKIILTIPFLTFTFACDEDTFLTRTPEDELTTATYFDAPEDIEQGMIALYGSFSQGVYKTAWHTTIDVMNDDQETIEDLPFNRFIILSTPQPNALYEDAWRWLYEAVFRANFILHSIKDVTYESAEDKNAVIAEARFLRALAYFHLVNAWGNVPVYEEPLIILADEYTRAQSTPDEVYDNLIEPDLLYAIDHLRSDNYSAGRADKGAARALLGKAYLYQEEYASAVSQFEEIVNNEGRYGYGLESSLDDIFNIFNEYNQESVFELGFTLDAGNAWIKDFPNSSAGALRTQYFAPAQVNGWENTWPTQTLIDEFEAADPRRGAWLYEAGDPIMTLDGNTGEYVTNVTYDPAQNRSTTGANMRKQYQYYTGSYNPNTGYEENRILIRYADVLLMYAEALANSGSDGLAKTMVNRVRERAFGAGYPTVDDYMTASGASLMEAIKHERRVELCFEGHRFFDLKRWGDDVTKLSPRGYKAHMFYLPIPPNEVVASGGVIKQNQGYN